MNVSADGPTYEMTYEVPIEMLRRAMTSWARAQRTRRQNHLRTALFVLLMVGIGAAIGVSGVLDHLSMQLLTGLLIGFYAGLALWLVMHRRDVKRLSAFSASYLERTGPNHVTVSEAGVTMSTKLGTASTQWAGYDQVIELKDATVLRSGAFVHPLPHAALPDGVTPEQFHADITRWQQEAAA